MANPFASIFGPGTDAPSYEALKRKREIADALMQSAMGTQPQNWGEGVGGLMKALGYRLMDRNLSKQEGAERQRATDQLAQIRGGMGPEGITEDQLTGLAGITSNPYAPSAVEAIAKSLMRRQLTPSESGGFTGGGLGVPMQMSAMDMPPEFGGGMGPVDPGEIPPEEGGPMPFGEPDLPPVQDMPMDLSSGIPSGPMSGAGEQLAQYSPKGLDVAGDIKLTEGQSKDLGFWNRMDGVEPNLQKYEDALTSGGEKIKGSIPFVGNALVSEDYQIARGDAGEWIAAILRKDTGAQVTDAEWALYGPIYIPQFGDKPGEIARKRERRKRAVAGIKKGLGVAEVLAEELAAERAKEAPPESDADAELFKKYGLE